MEITIAPQMIEKLSHSIEEIRVRALRNLEGKISKALVGGYAISFNGENLIRALLRWLTQEEPVREEQMTLNVIFLVLNSKYGAEIIKHLTRSFLGGELRKIHRNLKEEEHKNLLEDILSVVEEQSQVAGTVPVIDLTDDLSEVMENIQLDEVHLTPREYERCWSCPSVPDLQALKLMRESLVSVKEQNSAHAVEFLNHALEDYPAEWHLQPPYLITTLQELLTAGREVEGIFRKFNSLLMKRIPLRECTALYMPPEDSSTEICTQISVSKYTKDTFEIVSTILRGTEDQATINWCFEMFTQFVQLLTIDGNRLQSTVDFFLRELGILCKFYRKCLGYKSQDFTARKLYIRVLQLILKLREFSDEEELSLEELNLARLDVAVKSCYPELYGAIEKTCPAGQKNIEVLLGCEELLRPAVDLLRPLEELPDEQIILLGVEAVKTSSLHRSCQMVEKLLNAIVNCIHLFPGNAELQKAGEGLVLKLLANPCLVIQRCAYVGSAEKMKHFMSSLMNGEQLLGGRDAHSTFRNLGIPLTREILMEVVAYGCTHIDPAIHSSAETMLLYVLQSRVILKKHWMLLKETVFPILPLLQCWTTKTTKLGEAILSILHPDNDIISPLDCMQTSVRLLFCQDPSVRDTGISWLLYVLSVLPRAAEFVPNVSQIADTVPNDIVLLDYKIDMGARFRENSSQPVSVDNLLDILASEGVEPAVRKTTLMQLNLLAMDPRVNEVLSDGQGWVKVLEVLDTCFKVAQTQDYVDICIPAVGVLSKLLLHSPELRQSLSDEINLYFILMRALLMFHHDANLKADAATALFLLAFADYAIGAYSVSLPHLMKKLQVPFVQKTHWSESPHAFLSQLDEMFEKTLQTADHSDDAQIMWQFVRVSFANVWFSGLENVLVNARNSKREGENGQRINYAHILQGKEIRMCNVLEFSEKLRLTKKDLLLIHSSLPMDALRYFGHQIENATTHTEVATAFAHIHCNLSLDPQRKFPMESLVGIIKKFCFTPPTSAEDSQLFISTIQLLVKLLEHDEDGKVLCWLVNQMNGTSCTFASILRTPSDSLHVLDETVVLLRKVVEQLNVTHPPKNSEKCLGVIFSAVLKRLEGCFEKDKSNDMARARILIGLMATLAGIVSVEEDAAEKMINRLLLYTTSAKSLCQAGSKFIVNCLVAIRGFMEVVNEVKMKPKYLRHMSGLCSHRDMWVRQNSWMILCRMAQSFSGAELLIEELKFLPGGFHACCIGTVLDGQESGFIRHVAARTFSNLLSHRIPLGGIPLNVLPRCSEPLTYEDLSVEELILLIIRKHNVAKAIAGDLEHVYIYDAVLQEQDVERKHLTSPSAVHGFCVLLKSVVDIDATFSDILFEENCLQLLSNVLAMVPTNPTECVFQMAMAICSLLAPCLLKNEEILMTIGQNHAAIGAILFLQDPTLYSQKDSMQNMAKVFIKILSIFGNSSFGYGIVTTLAQQHNPQQFFSLVIVSLHTESPQELQLVALEFLIVYLQMGFNQNDGNFLHLIDPASVINEENEENNDPNEETVTEHSETEKPPIASLLFHRVGKLFETMCARDKPEVASFVQDCSVKRQAGKALALLLRCSLAVRSVAKAKGLFSYLIKRLDAIATAVGPSCADYVRRHGEGKKRPIVEELVMISQILCDMFAEDTLDREEDTTAICRVLQRLWTWAGSTRYLQNNFLVLVMNLSERSHPFCRRATISSGNSESILDLMLKKAAKETNKAKQEDVDILSLRIVMRFLTNCCSCIEGRIQMTRQGVLENISQFHPCVTRIQRPQHAVTEEWLTFYEVLSRYPEGRAAKYLTVLTALIEQKNVGVRRKAVEIVRNFAMEDANTAALLASENFMRTVKLLLDGNDREDQQNIAVAIWAMVANNQRAKNAIKSTSIPGRCLRIQDQLILADDTIGNRLFTSLENISKILSV